MMIQEEKVSPAYEASSTEIQSIIMEWVEATEQFHRRYAKLTDAINSLQSAGRRQSSSMANRSRLRKLITLRHHMSDVLMTLMLDMNGQKAGRSLQSSKPGQLHSHARLLSELNREIDAELTNVKTVAQA
ncbi:hypothetical protein [Spirosoma agri]|uniref:Uncharacterized protein n=1 Tax=Spirosoma agri TaxID=1987381 RepID=A0A6M0IL25_9BACT|nr:hypothetical protein [Spirosoma agri]NEU69006.1 hypothetical protein [Spirosoma agri]